MYGNGSPTVVLVSGLDSPQASWDSVVPDLAAMTTVVTYDRAGVGKSEIGALPAHGEQSAKDLHALLDEVGVPRPFILVGHSFGGFVVRLFASMYPEAMAASIPGGRHILVEGTGHYIHVDRSQALIAPVVEMIEEVREKKED